MAKKTNGKKGKTKVKRMALTFTDSPLDQALYAALQQVAASDDTTLRPGLIKFYLRNVCGMLCPDFRILRRMGLPEEQASIYSLPEKNQLRKALECQMQLKNWLRNCKEMDDLTANVRKKVMQTVGSGLRMQEG